MQSHDDKSRPPPITYACICSGLSAPTLAAKPLGWKTAFFSEIEAFPRAVLTHHYPQVPLHGDFTTINGDTYGTVDLLVGGTPCQSFSVAGKRLGLDDPRGNLALEYVRLAERVDAKWLVFENVPGLLSSASGDDFAAFISAVTGHGWGNAGIAECKSGRWGIAWRILDAQYFGVAQRRRRLFVVGYRGDWRRAAAVLLEPESMRGNHPPSRHSGKDVAPTLDARSGRSGENSFATSGGLIAHTLRGEGFDASEDGTGRGTPLIPAALSIRGREGGATAELSGDVMPALRASQGSGDKPHVLLPSAVRRLTPIECERLQGMPDDFSLIPWRGKRAQQCPDGPRYRAIGNSMAVPVMSWIFARIDNVHRWR